MANRKWQEEIVEWLKENVPGRTVKEVVSLIKTQDFEEKYGMIFTEANIKGAISRYHIKSGLDGRFKKGQTPHNKGGKMSKEQYEKCKATMFQKGNTPKNSMEIGAYTYIDGYLAKKVKEKGKQRERFEFVHRAVWEENYGKIPHGHIVIFLDGNKDNCAIENLALINRREHAILNKQRLRFNNAESTKVGITIAKLRLAALDRIKQKERV